ncbi:MAG: aminotransferase class V-fold PLP-dependent enzyme [Ruminococcaceae bacterium]|nr:aminotransferase class V-fold PLP-dependent enzyme [Oscillospiraceae bacterium]
MNTPIHDFLQSYAEEKTVRCHMPGGKANSYDITEIEGADSLFESGGIIKSSETNAAKLYGAADTLFSCGGSTLSIQTMLALAKAYSPSKNRVVASRFCHKSLLTSCILLGLEVDWIYPDEYLSCRISPQSVKDKVNKDTLCVFAQSIDYYGGESDIKGISEVCASKNIPLLIDNAHGAYKVFTDDHPLFLGADMTADSAHKTLPCLTGGGYLHIGKNAPPFFAERAKETMSLFGSSSPSYLILDSLDLCNRHISDEKERAKWVFDEVKRLKSALAEIGYTLKESDPMRITIDANAYGYSGFALSEELRKRGITAEFSDIRYTVLLFSTAQPLTDFTRIFEAAKNITLLSSVPSVPVSLPESVFAMSPREAFFSLTEWVPVEKSVNRICADINTPCPPCVPLAAAGEVITAQTAEMLKLYGVKNIKVVK